MNVEFFDKYYKYRYIYVMNIPPEIALLATGDEITNGDIINTNGQIIAQQLTENNIPIGYHLTSNDKQTHIESALHFLMQHHQVIITIGGLGPTSDDRTRFAIANVINKPLIFDEQSWQKICERLTKLGYSIPDSNRNQCLFPDKATILNNTKGTANGCRIDLAQHTLFMLPGPPRECITLFEEMVLPWLKNNQFSQNLYRHSWLLLGVSEGDIAQVLDEKATNSPCSIGYRVDFPYLEVKIQANQQQDAEQLRSIIYPYIRDHVVSETRQKASAALKQFIAQQKLQISINDQATHGYLASILLSPSTFNFIKFNSREAIHFDISDMDAFWHATNAASFEIQLTHNNQTNVLNITNRGTRSLNYLVEHLCWEILKTLQHQYTLK